jgi:hypothetical protein
MKKAERAFAIATLLGVIIRDSTGFIGANWIILISATSLAILYLLGSWWLDQPTRTSFRTVSLSVMYGVASFGLTLSLLFKLSYYSGADQLTFLSFTLVLVAVIADALSSMGKRKVLTIRTSIRIAILVTCTIFLNVIPQESRIALTYRKHPGFLRYYREHKGKGDFSTLEEEYFESRQ